jgi:hypothetical protein
MSRLQDWKVGRGLVEGLVSLQVQDILFLPVTQGLQTLLDESLLLAQARSLSLCLPTLFAEFFLFLIKTVEFASGLGKLAGSLVSIILLAPLV